MPSESRSEGNGSEDRRWMRRALLEAQKAWGQTAPNPPVGCVLVKDGTLVAAAHTSAGGRPHAEANALAAAGPAACGATAYVTLEPCAHYGLTPPCADALIAADIARCVIASGADPDPRVNGRGTERLRQAGIRVDVGLLAEQAEACHGGFFKRITLGRPRLILKLATSLDGRIACANGKSQWITGESARRYVHLMRSRSDAILIGIGTLLADNPRLTCRLAKGKKSSMPQPIRIILDSHLQTPQQARLFEDVNSAPIAIVCRKDANPETRKQLQAAGAKIVAAQVDETDRGVTAHECLAKTALSWLAQRGCNEVLCEGGGHVAAHVFSHGLVDELAWFRAPSVIGGDGLPAITALGLASPQDAPRLELVSVRTFGQDRLEIYKKLSKS